MRMTRNWICTISIFTVLATGCGGGGGGGGSDNSNPAQAVNVINGITVPPDPGPAGDATVAGIDTDANGIRDDIDRFVATKYGTNPTAVKAARTSARALDGVLNADASNQTDSMAALAGSGDAGVCAGRDFRSAGLDASRELDELFLRTNNTQDRLTQRKAVIGAAGLFTRSVASVVCP
jgi:hypothetical protein